MRKGADPVEEAPASGLRDRYLQAGTLQQLGHAHVEGVRDSDKRKKGRVVIPSLDTPHVATVHVCHESQLLLGDSFGEPRVSYCASERNQGGVLALT